MRLDQTYHLQNSRMNNNLKQIKNNLLVFKPYLIISVKTAIKENPIKCFFSTRFLAIRNNWRYVWIIHPLSRSQRTFMNTNFNNYFFSWVKSFAMVSQVLTSAYNIGTYSILIVIHVQFSNTFTAWLCFTLPNYQNVFLTKNPFNCMIFSLIRYLSSFDLYMFFEFTTY